MSILDTYDPHSRSLFTPEHIYGKREKLADVCIVTFHHKVLEKVLAAYAPSVAARAFTANGPYLSICWRRRGSGSCFI